MNLFDSGRAVRYQGVALSYPAKSLLSPVKLENELEIEQIKWETLAVGRQIIWLYGQGSEP